jgi:hypothetical protein
MSVPTQRHGRHKCRWFHRIDNAWLEQGPERRYHAAILRTGSEARDGVRDGR